MLACFIILGKGAVAQNRRDADATSHLLLGYSAASGLPPDSLFRPLGALHLARGFKASYGADTWVKINVRHLAVRDSVFVLTLRGDYLGHLGAWVSTTNGALQEITGSCAQLPQYRGAVTYLLPHDTTLATVYLRFRAKKASVAIHNLQLHHRLQHASEHPTQLLIVLAFGALVIMIFYNLLIGLTLKDSNYFNYCYYQIALTVALFLEAQLGQDVIGVNLPFHTYYLESLTASLACIFVLYFGSKFYSLKQNIPSLFRWIIIPYALIAVMLLIDVLALVAVTLNYPYYNYVRQLTTAATLTYGGIVIGYMLLNTNYKPARIMSAAFIPLVAGVATIVLRHTDIIPTNAFTEFATYLGACVEAAVLSVSLGDRYKFFQKERNHALQANKELVEQQKLALEEQVAARTIELKNANTELLSRNEEVKLFNDRLEYTNQELQETISRVTQSIQYARKIQDAMLPRASRINADAAKRLILYKPKDIISGDFYWTTEAKSLRMLAVVDCTGHGVPGALMAQLGYALLSYIVLERGLLYPTAIITALDERMTSIFSSSKNAMDDGMELSIVAIDEIKRKLYLAGAKRPIWLYSNGTLTEIKGSVDKVGGLSAGNKQFVTNEIIYQPGDRVFMFTDGLTDQLNYTNQRRFSTKRLKEFMAENSGKTLPELGNRLTEKLAEWKGRNVQTDDICLVAVEL